MCSALECAKGGDPQTHTQQHEPGPCMRSMPSGSDEWIDWGEAYIVYSVGSPEEVALLAGGRHLFLRKEA